MTEKIHVHDSDLELASRQLCDLALQLTRVTPPTPLACYALSPIAGGAISEFLSAVKIAYLSLIDAARTTSTEVAGLLAHHSELDAHLASRFADGFALPGKSE